MKYVLFISGNYKDLIKQVRDFSEDGNWTAHPDW
jgi:hypothetical protein